MSSPGSILDWDSAFFGCTVARGGFREFSTRDVDLVLDWCVSEAVEWLHLLVASNHAPSVQLLQRSEFDLVDVRVQLLLDLETQNLPGQRSFDFEIRPVREGDLITLRPIAATVHRDSRFYYDHRLGAERASALYVKWLEVSCQDGFADLVLVAELGGTAQAYVTGSLDAEGRGHIGLVGVGEAARSRGIGSALLVAMVRWFVDHGVTRVKVVTQGRNVAAQRLYQRCGFVTDSVELWFHKWFDR